jgi:bifunctional DNA-binding transcriptional regulator/antitoxin component of YhaV-PrlF toxin-antitoxin module
MGRVDVIEGDRITLPREFRRQTMVREGDNLEYRVDNGLLLLSKPRKLENPTTLETLRNGSRRISK